MCEAVWENREAWKRHARRLEGAGDRIIEVLSRCSDQGDEELARFVGALRRIWDEAKDGKSDV
jgi:hypothetical protein